MELHDPATSGELIPLFLDRSLACNARWRSSIGASSHGSTVRTMLTHSLERIAAPNELDGSYLGQIERSERNIGIDNIGASARDLSVDVRVLFQFSVLPSRS